MKTKAFILTAFFAFAAIVMKAQSVEVYFSDNSGSPTNIRNAPKGKVVQRVPKDSDGMLTVEKAQNGWWKISGNSYDEPDKGEIRLTGAKNFYIHYSCIAVDTRNYGGQTLQLRSTPSSGGRVVYSFKDEKSLRPVDARNGWVKVKTLDGKHEGWIEAEWLCGNSVTNCC